MFRTFIMSASERGNVTKYPPSLLCAKVPQAQLTHLLKPTAFGLFTGILEVWLRNAPTPEFCICCWVFLALGSRAGVTDGQMAATSAISGWKLLPPRPVSPDKRAEMAFFHTVPRLFSPPGPSLTMKYGGKTDIQCYSPALFLFSAPT